MTFELKWTNKVQQQSVVLLSENLCPHLYSDT